MTNEAALKDALHNVGPVTVGIDATNKIFQLYKTGIITIPGNDVNHGVVAVGYGRENDLDFYKLRNSWGSIWGEDGYFRIQAGNNTVSIAQGLKAGLGVYPRM